MTINPIDQIRLIAKPSDSIIFPNINTNSILQKLFCRYLENATR